MRASSISVCFRGGGFDEGAPFAAGGGAAATAATAAALPSVGFDAGADAPPAALHLPAGALGGGGAPARLRLHRTGSVDIVFGAEQAAAEARETGDAVAGAPSEPPQASAEAEPLLRETDTFVEAGVRAALARDLCVESGLGLTIEDTWGGDIVTAAIAHLAHSTPTEHLFTSTDFNSYVTVSNAEGAPERKDGRMSASTAPGLGVEPRADVLGDPVAEFSNG